MPHAKGGINILRHQRQRGDPSDRYTASLDSEKSAAVLPPTPKYINPYEVALLARLRYTPKLTSMGSDRVTLKIPHRLYVRSCSG